MTKTKNTDKVSLATDVQATDQLPANDVATDSNTPTTNPVENTPAKDSPLTQSDAGTATTHKLTPKIKPLETLPIRELNLKTAKSSVIKGKTHAKHHATKKTANSLSLTPKKVHVTSDHDPVHHTKSKHSTVHGLARHYIDHISAKAYKDHHMGRELRHDPKTAEKKYDGQHIKLAKKVVAELPAIAYYHPQDYYAIGLNSKIDRYVKYLNEIYGHDSWVATPMLTHNLGAVREHYNLLPLTKDAHEVHNAIQHWIEELLNLESFYDTGHGLIYTAHAHYHGDESIPSHINITVEPEFFLDHKSHKANHVSAEWYKQIADRFEDSLEKLRHIVDQEVIEQCRVTFDKKIGKFTCKIPNFNLAHQQH